MWTWIEWAKAFDNASPAGRHDSTMHWRVADGSGGEGGLRFRGRRLLVVRRLVYYQGDIWSEFDSNPEKLDFVMVKQIVCYYLWERMAELQHGYTGDNAFSVAKGHRGLWLSVAFPLLSGIKDIAYCNTFKNMLSMEAMTSPAVLAFHRLLLFFVSLRFSLNFFNVIFKLAALGFHISWKGKPSLPLRRYRMFL